MKSDFVVALIRDHYANDEKSFETITKQIIADESSAGRNTVAQRIKYAIDSGCRTRKNVFRTLDELTGNLRFVEKVEPSVSFDDMILSEDIVNGISQVIEESRMRGKLVQDGLENDRHLLFHGPSGVGKTMAANALAKAVGSPLFIIRGDQVVESLLGKSSQNISTVFGYMKQYPGVYFFDEFDSFASKRKYDSASDGEVSRIVTSLLQFIDRDDSASFIIAATNLPDTMDSALVRRFDRVFRFENPNESQVANLVQKYARLDALRSLSVMQNALGLSHSNIAKACKRIRKLNVMGGIRDEDEFVACLRREFDEIKKAESFDNPNDSAKNCSIK